LRESQERLARIVETVPEGIVIVDRSGQITFANAAAERVLGLTRGAITDRAYNDPGWRITAVDGSSFPQEELPFAQVMRSGQPVHGIEHAIEGTDGQRVILSINAAPLQEADGTLSGMVAAISDITERKRAEEALQQMHECEPLLRFRNRDPCAAPHLPGRPGACPGAEITGAQRRRAERAGCYILGQRRGTSFRA
jgi:PAS domain S-box-containing protein